MASHDLTHSIVPFIDPHLALPLLGHLSSTELFNPSDVAKAQYELAKKSKLTAQPSLFLFISLFSLLFSIHDPTC